MGDLSDKFYAECARMERDALPCPFCGGKDDVYAGPEDWETFVVKCGRCGASGPPARIPDTHAVPKRFVVNGRVPAKYFAASREWLQLKLLRKAFRGWQRRQG